MDLYLKRHFSLIKSILIYKDLKSNSTPPLFLESIYYKMAGKQGAIKRPLPKQGYSPDLNKYVAKKLRIKLNGGREIEGIVIGVDVFMNLALEKAFEISGS